MTLYPAYSIVSVSRPKHLCCTGIFNVFSMRTQSEQNKTQQAYATLHLHSIKCPAILIFNAWGGAPSTQPHSICFSNHRCGLRSDWGLQLRNCSLKRSVIRREIKFKSYQFDISSGTDENPSGEKLLPRARMQKSEFFRGNSFTEKQKEYIWNINLCFIVIFVTGYDTNLILLYLSVYRYLFGFMQKKKTKKKNFCLAPLTYFIYN